MLISNLIEKLQKVKEMHGDIRVVLSNTDQKDLEIQTEYDEFEEVCWLRYYIDEEDSSLESENDELETFFKEWLED